MIIWRNGKWCYNHKFDLSPSRCAAAFLYCEARPTVTSMLCTFHDLFPPVKRCLWKILISLSCQLPCSILATLMSKLAEKLNLLFAHIQIALHGDFITEIAKQFRSADSGWNRQNRLINQRPAVSCCKVACYAFLSFLSRKPNSVSVISYFLRCLCQVKWSPDAQAENTILPIF